MSIGLDFVKKIDKDWKKHVKPLDLTLDNDSIIEKKDFLSEENDIETEMILDKTKEFWKYWKEYYLR